MAAEYTKTYATADDLTTERSTLNKVEDLRAKVIDISDPNILHQIASYTALFTLSGLSQDDLENTTTLLNSKTHDISNQLNSNSKATQKTHTTTKTARNPPISL